MRSFMLTGVAITVLTGCATIPVPPIADIPPPMITDSSSVKPIAIEKVVVQLPLGQQTGVISAGLLCVPHGILKSNNRGDTQDPLEIIHAEFRASGYPVANSPTDLFSTATADATRLRLAGRIVDTKANVCFPGAGFGDVTNGKADVRVRIEWQLYDSVRKDIIAKVSTDGYGQVFQTSGPLLAAEESAVGMATRRLLADPEFRIVTRAK